MCYQRLKSALILLLLPVGLAHAEALSLEQILQQVLERHPSLKSATLEVFKAEQNALVVESGLGWSLAGSAGIARDVSLIGSTVNRIDGRGSLGRRLQSGDSLSINAGLAYEDAETPLSPTLPNPVTSASVDLNYRMPMWRGDDNPDYVLGLKQAELGVALARAGRQAGYDQLAARIIDLYLASMVTLERISNLNAAVARTERLQKFINSRYRLGVAEDKDTLQVRAQMDNLLAQRKSLELAWTSQRIALNRLMGKPWTHGLELPLPATTIPEGNLQDFLDQSSQYSPALQQVRHRITMADNAIAARRDLNQDQLDLLTFVGARSNLGNSATGNADSNNWIGGVRVEYQGKTDRRGDDALLRQAVLDRGMALEDQRQLMEDLHYDLAGLLAQIRGLQDNIIAYDRSAGSERAKLKEADRRYRQGRIDIDLLIQFENQLSAAELALSLQRIELIGRLYSLTLMRGELWQTVSLPANDEAAVESLQ